MIRPINVGQLILTGTSHVARKDFTSTEETVVGGGECLSNFVFMVKVVTTTLTGSFIKTFICLG